MAVAVIVDIRLPPSISSNHCTSEFLKQVRAGLENIFNLQCTCLENVGNLSLVVCRSHPDDSEVILSPPITLHTAYEAIRWLDDRLDSEIMGSSPIAPHESIVKSLELCNDDNLSQIVFISRNCDRDTLMAITKNIGCGIAFTFFAVCSSYAQGDSMRALNSELYAASRLHRVITVVPSPDIWNWVFSEIRGLLAQPRACVLDLSSLLKDCSRTTTRILIRETLEQLIPPSVEEVCSCHGNKPDDIEPANRCRAIQLGSEFFCMETANSEQIQADCFVLIAKCFIHVEDACESKLSGPIFVGWQEKADESFEALRRTMIRRDLGLILERQKRAVDLISATKRYFMAFTNESSSSRESTTSSFALIRELISVDRVLFGWRAQILQFALKSRGTADSFSQISQPIFGESCQNLSSILISSGLHDQLRHMIASSKPFHPKNKIN